MTTVDDTLEQLTLVSVQTLKSYKNLKLNQMILAVTWAEIYAIAGKKPEKKIRLRRDSNPVPLNTSWTPLPTDRRNHTLGGREGGRS